MMPDLAVWAVEVTERREEEMTEVATKVPLTLDVAELKSQAAWLMELPPCSEAEGLLNLLDAIRDHLVDHAGVRESDVFSLERGS